ncbi:MAG: hypothetical protein EB038_10720, partial [Cyclobacteriaceae bacterium]|nr:hypothetical protein [Cyclobacteriaceae bacterium]
GLGYISPVQSQEIREKATKFGPEFYKTARASEVQAFPTVEEAEKKTKEYLPFTGYEPKTQFGKYSKSAAEGAGSGAVGRLKYLPSGMAIGAASGIGSEVGSQLVTSQDPLSKAGAQVTGAILGGLAGGKISNLVREFFPSASGAAANRVYQSLADDINSGQSKLNIEQINEAIRSGQPITLADIAGPKTLSIIETYGSKSPEAGKSLKEFFKETTPQQTSIISPRDQERGKRYEKFRDEYAQGPVTAPDLEAAIDRIGSQRRGQIYNILKQDPAAQNISANNFADLYMKPEFRKAVDDAMNVMANAKTSWGIQAQRSPITFTSKTTGEKFNPVDGNLSFYDHVKRSLDEE